MSNQIGVVGLGTMGKALAQNLISHGFKVAGFNRSFASTKSLIDEGHKNFEGFENITDFISSLEKPRKILLMLPAGKSIDDFLEFTLPLLEKDDIIADCGNSFYKDTIERFNSTKELGINFFGVGVSGGEKGARFGPSIMPSGDAIAYQSLKPFLETISAHKDSAPCCAYIGTGGSGHYVKMVHNGIEYADMQLIAELYLFLRTSLKLSNNEIAEIFDSFGNSPVKSYLIDITASILRETDDDSNCSIVDKIADHVSQKGTGKWTVLEAVNDGRNVSLIYAALDARIMSNLSQERTSFSLKIPKSNLACTSTITIEEIQNAYYIAKIVAYAQGFAQIKSTSDLNSWELNLSEIASIWREGCIIKAELLDVIADIFKENFGLKNMLLSNYFIDRIKNYLPNLRLFTSISVLSEIPIPTFSAALTYIDQLKSMSTGANLVAAQRDFFGAHGFERIDKEGAFKHVWND